MSKVYRHKPLAPDEYIGRIEPDGKTYESQFGPDHYVGRVDLSTGHIYESRLGPDKPIGRVDIDTGKIYHRRMGPDEYLGRVHDDGKCYLHKPMASDTYIGRVDRMVSTAHGGAAFLLLILPALEEIPEKEEQRDLKPNPAKNDLGDAPEKA